MIDLSLPREQVTELTKKGFGGERMNYRRVARGALPAVFAATLFLAACGGDDESSTGDQGGSAASEAAITVQGFVYAPTPLTVGAGTTVTWTNRDQILHTATSGTPDAPTGEFDGVMEGVGTTFSHRFETAGSYLFFCDRHNGMAGEVVVTP